jgi:hypothetical protein
MMRTSRDYRAAVAAERRWNDAPAIFQGVRLLAEDLRLVGVRQQRHALSEQGLAAPPRLVRTHVEGGVTLAADAASLPHFLTFVTGGAWMANSLPAGTLRQLVGDGGTDPASLSLVRRLATRDDWQQFTGLRVRGLRLVPASDAGLLLMLDLVGAEMAMRRRVSVGPQPALRPPLMLRPPPDGLVLAPAGLAGGSAIDGPPSGALMVAGFEIAIYRAGMRPHFALAANSPQMILPGQLAAQLDIRLLASDAAKALTASEFLSAGLRFEDESRRFEISFPALTLQDRRERVDADGGPAMIHLRARAAARDGVLLRLRELARS